MHKKPILFLILTIVCLAVHSADADFAKALRNCTPFSGSGSVQTGGMNVKSTKRISGWQGDKCVYKESVNFAGINSDIVCKFTKPQVEELASVLEAYELMQKYADDKPDFSNLEEAQKNPVSRAWQKYLSDEAVCTISTVQT